jgi:hypothetical protein
MPPGMFVFNPWDYMISIYSRGCPRNAVLKSEYTQILKRCKFTEKLNL